MRKPSTDQTLVPLSLEGRALSSSSLPWERALIIYMWELDA